MRGSSRHGSSRPERGGGRAGGAHGDRRPGRRQAQAGPRAGGRDRQPGWRPAAGQPAAGQPAAGRAARSAVEPERLAGLIGPVVSAAGLDLESVRAGVVGRRLLLRVVVDADGGVALDDIADISRDVGAVLDAADVMGETPYTLEVSSPGVDRPLTEPRHWRRAAGRLVRVPLTAEEDAASGAEAARRTASLQGRVVVATDDGVTLEVDGTQQRFGYHELGPGKVQVEFGRVAEEPGGPDGGEPDGH